MILFKRNKFQLPRLAKSKEKGIALLITFFIMVIGLSIVLGISAILIGEMKMIRGMGNSVRAFYAADSGVERALYRIRQESNYGNFSGTIDSASYDVEITDGAETIKSVGLYNNTKRAIEITYQ